MSAFMFKLRSQSLLVIRTCCAFAQYVANGIGRNEGCAGSWDNTCAPRMECCPGSASSSNTDYCCPAGEHKLATQGGYYCQLDKDCYSGHCCSNGSCCTYMEQQKDQKECYSDRDCHPAQQCCHDVNNLNDQSHCCYASDDNSQNDTTDYTLWLIFSVGGTLTFLCIVPILIGVCFVCLNNDTINRTKAASARRHHSRTHGATNRIAQAPATHDPKMHSSQMNNPQYLSMGSNSTNLGFHQSTQSNYGFVVPPSNTANRQQLPPLKSQHPTSTTLTTPAVPHLSRPAAVDASTIPPPPVYYPLVFR